MEARKRVLVWAYAITPMAKAPVTESARRRRRKESAFRVVSTPSLRKQEMQ